MAALIVRHMPPAFPRIVQRTKSGVGPVLCASKAAGVELDMLMRGPNGEPQFDAEGQTPAEELQRLHKKYDQRQWKTYIGGVLR